MHKIARLSRLFIYSLFLVVISNFTHANSVRSTPLNSPLLLTGYVKAKNNQAFYAPKTDSWRVQIKWMLE